MNEQLAEYLGIHYGDGNLSLPNNHTYSISVCLNLKEKQYALYVRKLYLQLFNKLMHYSENEKKNSITLRTHQKVTWSYLHQLGAPIGKKEHLVIPKIVKKEEKYLSAFLRGLFDTDGCITIQRDKGYKYPLIKISMKSKIFANEVQQAYTKLGIKSYICTKSGRNHTGYDVTIRRRESLQKFSKVIGSRKKRVGALGLSKQTLLGRCRQSSTIRTQISTCRTT